VRRARIKRTSGNRSVLTDGGDIYSTPVSLVTDISASVDFTYRNHSSLNMPCTT